MTPGLFAEFCQKRIKQDRMLSNISPGAETLGLGRKPSPALPDKEA